MSFKEYINKEINPKLMTELGIKNPMALPKVTKIVVNVGVGEAIVNKKAIEKVVEDVSLITGQKPVVTKARKSVSAFKLRKGLAIGVKVTLRGERMYSFLEKLIKIVLPRIRDFRGISNKNFDGRGNYNLGVSEQILFPEIEYDKIDKIRGLEITIVTNARTNEKGEKLLSLLGMPFRDIKWHWGK